MSTPRATDSTKGLDADPRDEKASKDGVEDYLRVQFVNVLGCVRCPVLPLITYDEVLAGRNVLSHFQ